MNKRNSSIFLHEVTLLDCAYIDYAGIPCGLSVNPIFTVSGSTNNSESVVVDFSKCKKVIKELIDNMQTGFDHKLWVDPNHDRVTGIQQTPDGLTHVLTSNMSMVAPTTAFRFLPDLLTGVIAEDMESSIRLLYNIEQALSQYLTENMSYLGVTVDVCVPEPEPTDMTRIADHLGVADFAVDMFDYVHGLPDSSSLGCQNPVHGHSSFVFLGQSDHDLQMPNVSELANRIADYLHSSYLYDVTNEGALNLSDGLHYQYTTERGKFKIHLGVAVELVAITGAPTIENITEHIAVKFAQQLNDYQVTTLMVSEGLLKGALLQSNNWVTR